MLNWSARFSICSFLDNHQYPQPEDDFECLLAVNADQILCANESGALEQLQTFIDQHQDWCFGHLGYDLKNEIEHLHSGNPDFVKFDQLCFFIPETVLLLTRNELRIGCKHQHHEAVAKEIFCCTPFNTTPISCQPVQVQMRFTREEYLSTVRQLQQHIQRGDCYEVNFCQEFFHENAVIDPLNVYRALCSTSPNPFSCYYRLDDRYLLCASPERYLQKRGSRLLSQPIKGTARRHLSDPAADRDARELLRRSVKERAENIMIVDLVRNDLSKVCREGTVKVEELMGIYPFPQVYQMISTLSGEVEEHTRTTDILSATFPMGSMTGAPKKRVMELIEQYERTKRGLFSGSVGYITPQRDMDFNVVIRSILYNDSTRYLSFQTGSAITWSSNPEAEYEECLLKAEAIKKVLGCFPGTS